MQDDVEDESDDEDNSLPRALLPGSSYHSFICGACVVKSKVLSQYAGTRGVRMVAKRSDAKETQWEIYGEDIPEEEEDVNVDVDGPGVIGSIAIAPLSGQSTQQNGDTSQLGKRALSSRDVPPDPASPPRKRVRASGCTAPKPDPQAQRVLAMLRDPPTEPAVASPGMSAGAGDIFLSYGWRDRWCRCDSVCCYFG